MSFGRVVTSLKLILRTWQKIVQSFGMDISRYEVDGDIMQANGDVIGVDDNCMIVGEGDTDDKYATVVSDPDFVENVNKQ